MKGRMTAVAICSLAAIIVIAVNLGGSSSSRALPRPHTQAPPVFNVQSQTPPMARGPVSSDLQSGLKAIVAKVRPAVVSVFAHPDVGAVQPPGVQMLTPFPRRTGWVGSGILIDPSGYILTSRQVTGNAELARVKLFRGGNNTSSAKRVFSDRVTDLVLLKMPFGKNLPHAHIGDSSSVRTGDIVLAAGSPFGLAETVTHGIVSANRRISLREGEPAVDVIQTDAPINQGNCGGPLINIHSEVIGVNMAIYSTDATFSGIGFAIASNQASTFITSAIRHGR